MVIIPSKAKHLVIISEGQSCPTILVTNPCGVGELAFRLAFLPAWAGELAGDRRSALVEWADYSTPAMLGLPVGRPPRTPVFATGQTSARWRVFELDGLNRWPVRAWLMRDLIGPVPHPEPSAGWIQPADWPARGEVYYLTPNGLLFPDEVRERHRPPHWWPY